MNKIKICIFCLLAVILFSCNEDYEDFDSKAFIDSDSKLTTYLIKPDVSEYSTLLNVSVPSRPLRISNLSSKLMSLL